MENTIFKIKSELMPILHIYPIIIPLKLFKDRHNEINTYVGMNPSMFIEPDGNVTILIREVNYRKFKKGSYSIYGNISTSLYSILKGKVFKNEPLSIENMTCSNLTYEYNIPTYPSYWIGLEDIRFVTANSLLAIIPECHPGGKPAIFKATLTTSNNSNNSNNSSNSNPDDSLITSFVSCKPDKIDEKNWLPYIDTDGSQKIIYSLSPFRIKSIEEDDLITISLPKEKEETLKGYHGSTNGIEYNNGIERLFLIHINNEKPYHRWLLFNPDDLTVKVSKIFTFFKYSHIEFSCSLCSFTPFRISDAENVSPSSSSLKTPLKTGVSNDNWYNNNRIFITLGVNDDKAFIMETCPLFIDSMFAD